MVSFMPKPTPTEKQAHSPTRRLISYLTPDETKRLFAAIKSKRDRAFFLTAYRHGLRACEIGYSRATPQPLSQPAASARTRHSAGVGHARGLSSVVRQPARSRISDASKVNK